MDFIDLIEDAVETGSLEPDTEKAITRQDPLDPYPVIALFDRFHGKIDGMSLEAISVEVSDHSTNETAVTLTTQCKKLVQTLEQKRKEVKEPYLKVTRLLDDEVKCLRDRLGDIQGILNNKITKWLRGEEQKRLAELRRQDEIRRAEQAKIDEERRVAQEKAAAEARARAEAEGLAKAEAEKAAEEAAENVPVAPVVVIPEPKAVVTATETGTAKLKTKTVWEIGDFKRLPDKALADRMTQLSKAMSPWINAQIKAGVKEIPGVNIYETQELETRTRR